MRIKDREVNRDKFTVPSDSPRSLKILSGLAIVALVIGAIFRLRGIGGDLWLDEIWSINNLDSISSFSQIFTSLKTDNNHLLNSAYLYLVGYGAHPIVYRFPALIFSLAVLILAPSLSFHRGKRETLFSIILISLSYPIILLTTEARGYSGMLFFSVIALMMLHSYASNPTNKKLYWYWIASILGFLSHFGFFHLFLGLVCWSVVRIIRTDSKRAWMRELIIMHAVPAVFIFIVVLFYVLELPAGTGPLRGYMDVIANTVCVLIGQPELSVWNLEGGTTLLLVALVVLLLLCIEIIKRFFEGDETWAVYFFAVIVAPALFLLVFEPRVLFVRYFLIGLFLSYFLIASFLDRIWLTGSSGQGLVFILLAAYIYGQGTYLKQFWKYDRGDNKELVEFLRDQSTSDDIYVTGSQSFRDQIILEYYGSYSDPKKIFYLENGPSKAEWYLDQTQDRFKPTPPEITLEDGTTYEFAKEFPFTALSGWRWWLFKRSIVD